MGTKDQDQDFVDYFARVDKEKELKDRADSVSESEAINKAYQIFNFIPVADRDDSWLSSEGRLTREAVRHIIANSLEEQEATEATIEDPTGRRIKRWKYYKPVPRLPSKEELLRPVPTPLR